MKPTGDDFEPRRDGWFEHKATWDEVRIGTVLATEKRTERWEVIAMAHGQQVEFGRTMWFKVREQATGAEHNIEPKVKTASCKVLTQDPADTDTGDHTEPSDTEAIMLLVAELGAEMLATKDEVTSEVTCPDYDSGANHLDDVGNGSLARGLAEHLRFAHGLNPPDGIDIASLLTVHGQSHDPKHPQIGKAGFPHRHVPEDLTLIQGER